MKVNVEIFSQGEEVVSGQTVDSNAAWLSQRLIEMGFTVTRHTSVGDKLADLAALLQEISERADCCICSGGLGPTTDDLTAEAVTRAFQIPLEFDEVAYRQIQQHFNRRNREMPQSNRKQAMLPQGSVRLDNEWGTAPGFTLQQGQCRFMFIPGVPYEMRNLFSEKIKPILSNQYSLLPAKRVTIKTVGIGESDIQERIEAVELPPEVVLSFRAGVDEIQTKLLFPPSFPEPGVQKLTKLIAEKMGDFVFAIDGLDRSYGNLAAVVAVELEKSQATVAVVETISQGVLTAKFIGYQCLHESIYGADMETLFSRLGLEYRQQPEPDAAADLAREIRMQTGADIALVQLFKGMSKNGQTAKGHLDKNSPATLYNVLATVTGVFTKTDRVSGPIKRKQNQSAVLSLDCLRRYLQKLEF